MNRNENEAESFAGNFVVCGEYGLFFEVPFRHFGLLLTVYRYRNVRPEKLVPDEFYRDASGYQTSRTGLW